MRVIKFIVHTIVSPESFPMASRIRLEKVARFGISEYDENMFCLLENEMITVAFIFRDWKTEDAVSPFIVPRKMFQDALNKNAIEFLNP
jgi:hypothetical protein